MKRNVILGVLFLLLTGCAWYNDLNGGADAGMSPVSQVGGGYISSDTANDVTPFMFRSVTDGHDYLFFASDRGNAVGSYDIYYSMKVGSDFTAPVKLEGVSTSGGSEKSPVVFYYGTTTVIAYISDTADGQDVIFYQLSLSNRIFSAETTLYTSESTVKAVDLAYKNTNMIYIGYENRQVICYDYAGDMMYTNDLLNADSAFTSIDVPA
jgi:hypothetical protein